MFGVPTPLPCLELPNYPMVYCTRSGIQVNLCAVVLLCFCYVCVYSVDGWKSYWEALKTPCRMLPKLDRRVLFIWCFGGVWHFEKKKKNNNICLSSLAFCFKMLANILLAHFSCIFIAGCIGLWEFIRYVNVCTNVCFKAFYPRALLTVM